MKNTLYILLFLSALIHAQNPIETSLVTTSVFEAGDIINIDNFGTTYFISDNVFSKTANDKTITYNNIQLGELNAANVFNPLKINLFYKDFNSVVVLDNRLAEIFKIDFNQMTPYKNVTHISTGYDNTIWIFNQDTQRLELFDYKTKTTRIQTIPIQSPVLDIKSNYNYCWVLTEKYLYRYNYFGSLIMKIENDGCNALAESNENIILKKGNNLFYLKNSDDKPQAIKIPNLLINQFFVTNETLYIYNNKTLHELQLKIK